MKNGAKASGAKVKGDKTNVAKRLGIHLIVAKTIDVRANEGPGSN